MNAQLCHVPGCGEPGRLYAAGWLCDGHKPGGSPIATALSLHLVHPDTPRRANAEA